MDELVPGDVEDEAVVEDGDDAGALFDFCGTYVLWPCFRILVSKAEVDRPTRSSISSGVKTVNSLEKSFFAFNYSLDLNKHLMNI